MLAELILELLCEVHVELIVLLVAVCVVSKFYDKCVSFFVCLSVCDPSFIAMLWLERLRILLAFFVFACFAI